MALIADRGVNTGQNQWVVTGFADARNSKPYSIEKLNIVANPLSNKKDTRKTFQKQPCTRTEPSFVLYKNPINTFLFHNSTISLKIYRVLSPPSQGTVHFLIPNTHTRGGKPTHYSECSFKYCTELDGYKSQEKGRKVDRCLWLCVKLATKIELISLIIGIKETWSSDVLDLCFRKLFL